jgi:hypothetical protein
MESSVSVHRPEARTRETIPFRQAVMVSEVNDLPNEPMNYHQLLAEAGHSW